MASVPIGPSPARRDALAKRIRLLVAATITYNVVEAVVALTAGTLASSTVRRFSRLGPPAGESHSVKSW